MRSLSLIIDEWVTASHVDVSLCQLRLEQHIMPNLFLRDHPKIQPSTTSKPFPETCGTVDILHPIRRIPFLVLPAYDYSEDGFGVHLGTVMTARWALAVNRNGYLTSIDNESDEFTLAGEQDDVLLAGEYLYFLENYLDTEDYEICVDFRRWEFPDNVPAVWDTSPSIKPFVGPTSSDKVKGRDARCVMSGETWSLTTALVVPRSERVWVRFIHFGKLSLYGYPL
jgi:hypothetical protein